MRIKESSFTRPADVLAYAAGDLVANSVTAGSVVLPTFEIPVGGLTIRRFKLRKSTTGFVNAQFRVHLWEVAPTFTVGDNAAFNVAGLLGCDRAADYIGSFDVTMARAFSDGAWGDGLPAAGVDAIVGLPASDVTLHWALEALAAYTPGSEEIFSGEIEGFEA